MNKLSLTPDQYEALKPHAHLWEHFKKDSTIPSISHPEKLAIEDVYKQVFNVGGINLYCPQCVLDMIRGVFNLYDKYYSEIVIPEDLTPEVITEPEINETQETESPEEIKEPQQSEPFELAIDETKIQEPETSPQQVEETQPAVEPQQTTQPQPQQPIRPNGKKRRRR